MKSIADFVVGLTRPARDVHALSEGEKLRLLGRAYVTIREGWRVLRELSVLTNPPRRWILFRRGECPPLRRRDEGYPARSGYGDEGYRSRDHSEGRHRATSGVSDERSVTFA